MSNAYEYVETVGSRTLLVFSTGYSRAKGTAPSPAAPIPTFYNQDLGEVIFADIPPNFNIINSSMEIELVGAYINVGSIMDPVLQWCVPEQMRLFRNPDFFINNLFEAERSGGTDISSALGGPWSAVAGPGVTRFSLPSMNQYIESGAMNVFCLGQTGIEFVEGKYNMTLFIDGFFERLT